MPLLARGQHARTRAPPGRGTAAPPAGSWRRLRACCTSETPGVLRGRARPGEHPGGEGDHGRAPAIASSQPPASQRGRLDGEREQRFQLLLGLLVARRGDLRAGEQADHEHEEEEREADVPRGRDDRDAAELAQLALQAPESPAEEMLVEITPMMKREEATAEEPRRRGCRARCAASAPWARRAGAGVGWSAVARRQQTRADVAATRDPHPPPTSSSAPRSERQQQHRRPRAA